MTDDEGKPFSCQHDEMYLKKYCLYSWMHKPCKKACFGLTPLGYDPGCSLPNAAAKLPRGSSSSSVPKGSSSSAAKTIVKDVVQAAVDRALGAFVAKTAAKAGVTQRAAAATNGGVVHDSCTGACLKNSFERAHAVHVAHKEASEMLMADVGLISQHSISELVQLVHTHC